MQAQCAPAACRARSWALGATPCKLLAQCVVADGMLIRMPQAKSDEQGLVLLIKAKRTRSEHAPVRVKRTRSIVRWNMDSKCVMKKNRTP